MKVAAVVCPLRQQGFSSSSMDHWQRRCACGTLQPHRACQPTRNPNVACASEQHFCLVWLNITWGTQRCAALLMGERGATPPSWLPPAAYPRA